MSSTTAAALSWGHNKNLVSNLNKIPTTLKNVPIIFLGVMALLVLALGSLGWLLLE